MSDEGETAVKIDAEGTIVVVGDVDMATGPHLEVTILEHEGHSDSLVLDLGQVRFIDSSGLRVLLGAARRAHQRGGDVVLRGVGAEVMRLLEITATTGQFVVEDVPATDV